MGELKARQKRRIRAELRRLYGDFCHWCSQRMIFEERFFNHPLFATIEHLTPRAHGGNHQLPNLRLAHKRCNNERRDNLRWAPVVPPEPMPQQGIPGEGDPAVQAKRLKN